MTMNREVCKFLSGAVAGIAYAHGAYAVATSSGIMNEPIFLGRRWGVGYMWTETVVYSAISLALGYYGWSSKPEELQEPRIAATDEQRSQDLSTAQDTQLSASR
jgi:hypothetical protein